MYCGEKFENCILPPRAHFAKVTLQCCFQSCEVFFWSLLMTEKQQ